MNNNIFFSSQQLTQSHSQVRSKKYLYLIKKCMNDLFESIN